MEVYLVRHTKPDVAKGLIYGHLDVPLARDFEEEAIKVMTQLPAQINVLYTSPLQRCRLLSEKIQAVDKFTDHRLKEVNFGAWEGQYWDDIPKSELDPWMEDYVNQSPPNGESLMTMQGRVLTFWKEMLQIHKNQKVVLITHGGVIRILRGHLEEVTLDKIFDFKVDYGTVFKYQL